MKKLIIFLSLIFLIPYILITLLIKEENKKLKQKIINNEIVRIKREEKNQIENINIEEYVIGVVAGEMPLSFDDEALKAQSVCARTYVKRKMLTNQNQEYDVVDTIQNQVYKDKEQLQQQWKESYETNYEKLKNIVNSTKGEYMTYKDDVIETFFFSTSNGKTENSEDVFVKSLPYLRSVDSSFDEEVSPVFNDQKEMSLLDFYTKLGLKYEKNLNIEIVEKNETGSINKIKINGITIKGTEVRKNLGLRSTYFTVEQIGTNVKITTKGNGHGVGMSQYGALSLAKKGYTYDKILKYYYTGIEIKKISIKNHN